MERFVAVTGILTSFLLGVTLSAVAQDQQQNDQHQNEQHQNEQQNNERGNNAQQRRIPDFRAHFGPQHHFAPKLLQVYQGRPSFSYDGYRFALVRAWPTEWSYDDDEYYIDYNGGEYWLYNVLYPGARVEVIIV